jgi:hypothetical protein
LRLDAQSVDRYSSLTHDQNLYAGQESNVVSKTFFEELLESVAQANEIMRGTRAPSRVFHVDGARRKISEIRPAAIKRYEQSAPSRNERRS